MLLCFLFLSAVFSTVSSHLIHGSIILPFADDIQTLSVVAYSRNGLMIDVSPVTNDASFKLHSLAVKEGDYTLHVMGAVKEEFDSQFVQIVKSHIRFAEVRQDPLILPNPTTFQHHNDTIYLNFASSRKTNYKREKQPWRLKHLWAYRFRFLQLAAVAFVVWFPQFIRSLPKELRDELMGETEDDLGDVTAVFQALSGYKQPSRGQPASSSATRR